MDSVWGIPPLGAALALMVYEEKLKRANYRLLGPLIKQLPAHLQKEVKLLPPHTPTDLAEDVEYFNSLLHSALGVPKELLNRPR